jgi:DNA-binding CsgD family transcriptional regulator
MAEYGESLTEREIEVLRQVATGATNRQVAHELAVSFNTVKVHLRNIYAKLGVESRTEATMIAIQRGLVSVQPPETEIGAPEASTVPEKRMPTVAEDLPADLPAEPLPPLPWRKRLALTASLILVTLVSIATWPQSQAANISPDPDTDGGAPGGSNGGSLALSENWHKLAPMTTERSRFALVVTASGRLYAIGGETNGGVTGSVERYDPVADQWTLLVTNKPTRVSNIGAGVIDQWIYVPGGRTADGEPTDIVEAYSLRDEKWSQVRPLPAPLYAYALAVLRGKLYLFGGRNDRGYVDTTLIYDPQRDEWQRGREMPSQRAYAAAAALGSRIFVVGGYDGRHEQSTCQVYNPEEDSWETCGSLTQGRGGLGLVGVANRLYAVGGGWANYLGFSEEYDPTAAEWTPFETPVSRRWHNLAIASTPSRFYLAGGWNGDYLNGVWEYVVLPYEIFIPAAQP